MTLDEAIKHAEEVAEEQENKAKVLNGDFYQSRRNDCLKCGKEHRQLAEWLRKYQKIREIVFPLQFCSTDKLEHEAIMKICKVIEDGDAFAKTL